MSKIYKDLSNVSSDIVANSITTLKDTIWREEETTSGRSNVTVFNSNKNDYLIKRQSEIDKGYLTESEYNWMISKFFNSLSEWYSLYSIQVVKYELKDNSTYLNYINSYNSLIALYEKLKLIQKDSDNKYSLSSVSSEYLSTWQTYYQACDDLDLLIIAKIKQTSIVRMLLEYSVNTSNDTPPSWREEADDVYWSEVREDKYDDYQALWGRAKYFYLDGSVIRNKPYLIKKATSKDGQGEDEGAFYITESFCYWTARGLKVEKDIYLVFNLGQDYTINYSIIEDKAKRNISLINADPPYSKKVILPADQENMEDEVTFKAEYYKKDYVKYSSVCKLYKQILGEKDAVYLGCFENVPTCYKHNDIEDILINGDFFLCKGKTGTDASRDFMFGVVYELEDRSSVTSRSAWKVCTDTTKISKTILDKIAIGAAQSDGTYENLIVTSSTTLSGNLTVNVESSKFKNIYPQENGVYSIGSAVSEWKNLYTQYLSVSNKVLSNLIPNETKKYNLGSDDFLWNTIYSNSLKIAGQKQFYIQGKLQPYLIYIKDSHGVYNGVILWSNGLMIQHTCCNCEGNGGYYYFSWSLPFRDAKYSVVVSVNQTDNDTGGFDRDFVVVCGDDVYTCGKRTTMVRLSMATNATNFSILAIGRAADSTVKTYLENPTFDFE